MQANPDFSMRTRSRPVSAWGRLSAQDHAVSVPRTRSQAAHALRAAAAPLLGVGMRRSYGDVCLNAGGTLIATPALDRFIAADWTSGVVEVEAGLTIDALLRVCVPKGWTKANK